MSVSILPAPKSSTSLSPVHYTLDMIRDEVRQLVEKGIVSRHQPIYTICQYIHPREWVCVECELERCDYLLRDQIGDLIPAEEWEND